LNNDRKHSANEGMGLREPTEDKETKMRVEKQKAFTLIELLVVIAIIALLLSIVMPAMRKAKDHARKIICQSNYKQLGVAFGTYESQTGYNFRNFKTAVGLASDSATIRRTWFWNNGTGDYAHEALPFAIGHLMNTGMLPSHEVLFCAGVKNLAHDRNYIASRVAAGDYTAHNTEDIYRMVKDGTLASSDRPLFWSTNVWIWKKEIRGGINSINNISSGAMMSDMIDSTWKFAADTNTTFRSFFNSVGVSRGFQHFNVLMQDFSVENPSDKDEEVVMWLWNRDQWPL
jgi:prepilin-type N-terminal cleavage/methylation domain-containing protein